MIHIASDTWAYITQAVTLLEQTTHAVVLFNIVDPEKKSSREHHKINWSTQEYDYRIRRLLRASRYAFRTVGGKLHPRAVCLVYLGTLERTQKGGGKSEKDWEEGATPPPVIRKQQ